MTSARTAWRVWLVAVCVGLVAVVVTGAAAVAASTSTAPPKVLAACWQLFVPRLTWRSGAALMLGAMSLAVIMAGAASVVRQLWASHRYARRNELAEDLVLDAELVRVVAESRPLAFTLGLLRPRIYISAGARERLTPEQLSAVVAHEAHHRKRRDPLRLMATRALAAALFFVPAGRALASDHARLAELDADAAAVAATRSEQPLAGALLLFAGSSTVVGAGIAAERVDALGGKRQRFALPLGLLAAGLAASLAIGAIGMLVGLGAPDRDGAHLPGVVEQACILARALLPLAVGAAILALATELRRRSQAAAGGRGCE